jgi:hypothetical protein
MDENTTGLASLKPGIGLSHGRFRSVIVSPQRVSLTVLMPAMT